MAMVTPRVGGLLEELLKLSPEAHAQRIGGVLFAMPARRR